MSLPRLTVMALKWSWPRSSWKEPVVNTGVEPKDMVGPAYRRLLVDAPGNLWARRFRPPWAEEEPSWYVFNEQGAWLGEITTPRGLWVFEIGADYLLGLQRDELDVPFVVMIPLERDE